MLAIENNYNYFYNDKQPLYRSLDTKININNFNVLYNNYVNGCYLEYPVHLTKYKLSNKISFSIKDNNLIYELMNNIFLAYYDNISFLFDINNINLINTISDEFKSCLSTNKLITNNILMINFINNIKDSKKILLKLQNKSSNYLNSYVLIMNDGYVIFDSNIIITSIANNIIIINKNNIKLISDNTVCNMFLSSKQIIAYAYNSSFSNIIKSSISDDKQNISYNYKCKITGKKINHYTELLNNGTDISIETCNINNFVKYSIHTNDITNIISQCTITDNTTGLRHRATHNRSSNSSNNSSNTIIKFDNNIEYHKEDSQVKVDNLNNKFPKNESFIGYKLCKSQNGEKRIVKLFIPEDAEVVLPIDSDFLTCNFKERASKAIVMDILLVDEDKEVSVVPEELVAYSYIYDDITFEYKVGIEVFPDSFDKDESNGCGNGIHFFRNKKSVIETYYNI